MHKKLISVDDQYIRYKTVVSRLGVDLCERLLKSLSSADGILQEVREDQEAEVLTFLRYHRVIGRCVQALQGTGGWLLEPLTAMYEDELATKRRRQEIAERFFQQYCFDMDVVLLKTSYTHEVLNDPYSVEPNGDVDFVVERPNLLVERLRSANLPPKTDGWPDPCHEMEVVYFESTRMELHRYIPLWSALKLGRDCVDLESRRVSAKTRPDGLDYRSLRKGAKEIALPGGRTVFYCDPLVHLVTVISSRYRDSCLYAHASYTKPPIRLSEMLDVRALLDRHKEMTDRLVRFCDGAHLHDAMTWFASTMSYWVGDDRLQVASNRASQPAAAGGESTPKLLAGGSWVDLPFDPKREALVHPTSADVLDRLGVGGVPIAVTTGVETAIPFQSGSEGGGVALSIGHTSLTDLEIGVLFDGTHLTLSMPISGDISRHQEFRAYVEVNSSFVELFGHRSLQYLQLRKYYDTWREGIGNEYRIVGDRVEVKLDFAPFRTAGNAADLILSVGVPQYPRDTDRGWVFGLRCDFVNSR